MDADVANLISSGVFLIHQWVAKEARRTETLAELAEVLLSLRLLARRDGQPDYWGHSWEYRSNATSMWEQANVTPDIRRSIQGALRYHVGNRLRAVVPPAELERAGLRTESPRERVEENRELVSAAADAKMAEWAGVPGSPEAEALKDRPLDRAKMILSATTILEFIAREPLPSTSPLEPLERALEPLERAATSVRGAITQERQRRALLA